MKKNSISIRQEKQQELPFLQTFSKNFKSVFRLNGLATALLLATNLLIAAVIGPNEFGRVSLINNIALFLMIPFNWGVNQILYRTLPLSDPASPAHSKQIISSALIFNLITSLVIGSLYALFFILFGTMLGLHFSIWIQAIAISFIINIYSLSEAFLRGKKQFVHIGILQIISAALFLLLSLFLLFKLNLKVFWTYCIAFTAARLLFSVCAVWKNRPSLSYVSVKEMGMLFSHGKSIMGNVLLGNFLLAADILIINYFYTAGEVGIYSAYKGGGILLFSVLFYEIFSVVFLPMIADKPFKKIMKKIAQWTPLFIAVYSLFTAIAVTVYIKILGKKYGLDLIYITQTALFSAVYALYQLINHVVNNRGKEYAKISFQVTLALMPPFLIILMVSIKYFGLQGAFIANIFIHLVLLVTIYIFALRKNREEDESS